MGDLKSDFLTELSTSLVNTAFSSLRTEELISLSTRSKEIQLDVALGIFQGSFLCQKLRATYPKECAVFFRLAGPEQVAKLTSVFAGIDG